MPTISVIMPVYKVEETLLRCSVESVLKQTYSNLELLIIDDGSPDRCGEICDKYAIKDKRVKVFHTDNCGVSAARNLGLEQCKGEFIAFIDSDDYISETYLEHLYAAIKDTKADYVKCGCKKVTSQEILNIDRQHKYKIVQSKTAICDLCYMKIPFPGVEVTAVWASLYKRKKINKIRFNTSMVIGEDFDFNFRAFQHMDQIVYLDCCEYGYFIRKDSVMRNGFDKKKLKTINQLENLIKTGTKTIYLREVISRSVNIGVVLLLMIPTEKNYSEDRKYVIEFLKKYRLQTIINPYTRIKVRMALLISFAGFDFMQRVFEWVNKIC